ncbi:ParB/RepB/Spo0J family partition protein [Spartinivicinus poritis]|uniref:ParB/RepB/Spo0J family partition protein n=1 Tax=Spartinivicinus poritis TaxID=2994640 RepID=A0ABT5UHK5_9GAMM|nr:ParB/RepB/Spo0J family partition protein [Spartinivicinus sp. A2-2]MDE1465845.1 ParB/RepB/Spo0J family partition protein [Spartinivicinus sp. A2-2]
MAKSFAERKKEKAAQRNQVSVNDLLQDKPESSSKEGVLLLLYPHQCFTEEQVRKEFDQDEISSMAASLKSNGQQQPIIVYPPNEKGLYKIDKGECRWLASQLIPNFRLKALIDPEAPLREKRKRIVCQIIENDQRNDLRPFEMANAIKDLANEKLTLEEIAEELGWITRNNKPNINKVSRYLNILKLPEEGINLVKQRVVTDLLTLDFLRKIYSINKEKFSALCELAKEDGGISRKRAEQEYKQCKSNTMASPSQEVDFSHERKRDSKEESLHGDKQNASQENTQTTDGVSENFSHERKAKTNNNEVPKIQSEIVIHVEIQNKTPGILVFDKPQKSGYAWVQTLQDERMLTKLEDLTITSIKY